MTFTHRFIFFFQVFILATIYHNPASADPYMGVYSESINEISRTYCKGEVASGTTFVFGMKKGMFGTEASLSNENTGTGIYIRSNTEIDFYAGIYHMRRAMNYTFPNYSNVQRHAYTTSPFVGIDYGPFSIRYFRYDVSYEFQAGRGIGVDYSVYPPQTLVELSEPISDQITQGLLWAGLQIDL